MEEEYTDTVVLTDEEGNEILFTILDIIPYLGSQYAVLLPEEDDSDEPEAVILEILSAEEENEEDMLQGVDDENVLDAVFALFLDRNNADDGDDEE